MDLQKFGNGNVKPTTWNAIQLLEDNVLIAPAP